MRRSTNLILAAVATAVILVVLVYHLGHTRLQRDGFQDSLRSIFECENTRQCCMYVRSNAAYVPYQLDVPFLYKVDGGSCKISKDDVNLDGPDKCKLENPYFSFDMEKGTRIDGLDMVVRGVRADEDTGECKIDFRDEMSYEQVDRFAKTLRANHMALSPLYQIAQGHIRRVQGEIATQTDLLGKLSNSNVLLHSNLKHELSEIDVTKDSIRKTVRAADLATCLFAVSSNLNAEWKVMGEVRVPACGFIQRDERTVDLIVSRDVAMAANEFLSRGIGTALLRMTSRGITLTQDVYSISLESTYYPAVYRTQCDPYVKCWNGAWTTSVCPPQPRNGGRGSH